MLRPSRYLLALFVGCVNASPVLRGWTGSSRFAVRTYVTPRGNIHNRLLSLPTPRCIASNRLLWSRAPSFFHCRGIILKSIRGGGEEDTEQEQEDGLPRDDHLKKELSSDSDGIRGTTDTFLEELRSLVRSTGPTKPHTREYESSDDDEEKDDEMFRKLQAEKRQVDQSFFNGVDDCLKQFDAIDRAKKELDEIPQLWEDEPSTRTTHAAVPSRHGEAYVPSAWPNREREQSPLPLDSSSSSESNDNDNGMSDGDLNHMQSAGHAEAVASRGDKESGNNDSEGLDMPDILADKDEYVDALQKQIDHMRARGVREGASSEDCSDQSEAGKLLSALKDLKIWRETMHQRQNVQDHGAGGAQQGDNESAEKQQESVGGVGRLRGGGQASSSANFGEQSADMPSLDMFVKDDHVQHCIAWLNKEGILGNQTMKFGQSGEQDPRLVHVTSLSRRRLAELRDRTHDETFKGYLSTLMGWTNDSRKARTYGGEDLTGLSGWGLTRAFVGVLFASGGRVVRDKAVVELGCGTGLLGLSAKMAGASTVVMTDRSTIALALAKVNSKLNGLGEDQGVRWQRLEWSCGESEDVVGMIHTADVVVASECVHHALDMMHRLRVAGKLAVGDGKMVAGDGNGRWDALLATAARLVKQEGYVLLCVRLRGHKKSDYQDAARELQDTGARFGLSECVLVEMQKLCLDAGVADDADAAVASTAVAPSERRENGASASFAALKGCVCCVMASTAAAARQAVDALCHQPDTRSGANTP